MAGQLSFNEKYPTPEERVYCGVYWPGSLTCSKKEDFDILREFQVRASDVVVMTYPRTGTRWVSEVVCWIYGDCDEQKMKEASAFLRVPRLEVKTAALDSAALLSTMPDTTTRIYTTHLYHHLAPKQIENAKLIFTLRNPKDSAVSYYHFYRIFKFTGSYKGRWEEFLEAYMEGCLAFGSYFDWLKSWWPMINNENVLIVIYEESKKDPVKMIKNIAQFLGKELSEEQVQIIARKTSFSTMQKNPQTNLSLSSSQFNFLCDSEQVKTSGEYVRKGEVGDWKNYFTPEQNTRFEQVIHEKLSDLNINFIYEI